MQLILIWILLGKNYEENCPENGMYGMQIQKATGYQTLQAFRTWRRQEKEGKLLLTSLLFNSI